jgi:hypothetical protein
MNILAIHRNSEILQTVIRLINTNPEWNGLGATRDEQALILFRQNNIEIVLLCAGIDASSEENLRSAFTAHNPEVIILQHYGGGSGLLGNEILQAIEKKQHKN